MNNFHRIFKLDFIRIPTGSLGWALAVLGSGQSGMSWESRDRPRIWALWRQIFRLRDIVHSSGSSQRRAAPSATAEVSVIIASRNVYLTASQS